MNLAKKIHSHPHICKVLISNDPLSLALKNTGIHQGFFDTYFPQSNFQEIYSTKGKTSFQEETESTAAGLVYSQTVNIQFPNADASRSLRIEEFKKARHILLVLSNQLMLCVGRNDFFQNTKPGCKVTANEKTTAIRYTVKSIFSAGYTQLSSITGFPVVIPNQS